MDSYSLGEQIGIGGFSTVYRCIHLKSSEARAVKVIDKAKIKGKIAQLDLEFRILMELDHPSIIKIFEIFETPYLLYIVQELCSGGEPCKEIWKRGKFSEEDASKIMRQLTSSLIYMHSFNICHGDIKAENLMLKYPGDFSSLKLIDFGFSKRLRYGEVVTAAHGTYLYLSPEFVMGYADIRADNWALGVVLYHLISGRFPFKSDTVKSTLQSIFHGVFSFDDPAFHRSSYEVRDLITKLMTRNPNERYTAYQAYHHPWIQRQLDQEDLDIEIGKEVLTRLRTYQFSGDFEKIICYMIALKLEDKEVAAFKDIFVKIDKDGDGMLNCVEFYQGRQFWLCSVQGVSVYQKSWDD
jgi:calcium-dependent protein kinase